MEIIREKKNGKGYEVNSQKRKSKSSKCEEILPRKRIPLFVFLICQIGKELIANTGLVKLWRNGHLHCWCKLRKNINLILDINYKCTYSDHLPLQRKFTDVQNDINLYKVIHFSIIIAKDWKQFICSLVRDRFHCIHTYCTIILKKMKKDFIY